LPVGLAGIKPNWQAKASKRAKNELCSLPSIKSKKPLKKAAKWLKSLSGG
jgi:hypothetical protein